MIQIAGKLSVRQVKGRKGVFAVGELISDVGNFKVKDSMLDQFDEGEYRGMFQVTRIFPESYIYYGRVVTEIRATLAGIELEGEDIKPVAADIPAEPDPAEHDAAPATKSAVQPTQAGEQSAQAPAGTVSKDSGPSDADPDLTLFGAELHHAVKNGELVKLDPTIDRTLFRQQRDRLKAMGYSFDAATQSWSKK